MSEPFYARRSGLVLGFHGCDESVARMLVNSGDSVMKPSRNDYDWLGEGMYFWENNETRALEFATESMMRKGSSVKTPSVVGAVLDLGLCLDLTDSRCISELREAYSDMRLRFAACGKPMPRNVNVGSSKDLFLRRLDCAVINFLHAYREYTGLPPYDSVKGAFFEGEELYPGAGFKARSHVQICVRNPSCVKGFFLPRRN